MYDRLELHLHPYLSPIAPPRIQASGLSQMDRFTAVERSTSVMTSDLIISFEQRQKAEKERQVAQMQPRANKMKATGLLSFELFKMST